MEPGFALLSTLRRTEEDLKTMRVHIERMESNVEEAGTSGYEVYGFHSLIAGACHNQLVSAVSDALLGVFKEILTHIDISIEEVWAHIEFEKKIYLLIRHQKPEAARRLMVKHLETLFDIIRHDQQKKRAKRINRKSAEQGSGTGRAEHKDLSRNVGVKRQR